MTKEKRSFDIELLFRALADRTRLRIINLIGQDELCVCFFVEVLQVKQSRISRHLAYLRKAGLVDIRRQGKWIHYRIKELPDQDASRILNDVRLYLARDIQMKRDREQLLHFCRSPQPPVQLQGAPRPASLAF